MACSRRDITSLSTAEQMENGTFDSHIADYRNKTFREMDKSFIGDGHLNDKIDNIF
jgi:hypothetical protein